MAGRRLPCAAEQNVGIFCLPGFVADRGQIGFSRGSLPRFFLHVRDPSVFSPELEAAIAAGNQKR
jgi:hypothetical protein